jgi:hypothetical protein
VSFPPPLALRFLGYDEELSDYAVIPGRPEGPGPEPMNTGRWELAEAAATTAKPVCMGSGLAIATRNVHGFRARWRDPE